ncbi:MAG TPA: glycine cleavage system protein GcvH [Anaeromyxobacteraceae bacterium]|nr:glycine cleavage system protein GcvH [Anaeromyxobacteraceae bacterium]
MNFPEDLRYTKDHEWARRKDDRVVVGITEFATDQLGDVVYVELPAVGEEVKKGEAFGVVESTKAVSDLYAPVSGKVVEVNSPLVDAPEGVNEDPYGDGWMIAVEPSDPKDLDELLDTRAYAALVQEQEE